MSDKDGAHMLSELQEARAEVDRLRDLLRRAVPYTDSTFIQAGHNADEVVDLVREISLAIEPIPGERSELQKAWAEVDRLRKAIQKHRQEMAEYNGAFYDHELWSALWRPIYEKTGGAE